MHHLGDTPEDILPTLEDLMKLTFIGQIMKEVKKNDILPIVTVKTSISYLFLKKKTMRMYGPVSGISPRITTEDTYID